MSRKVKKQSLVFLVANEEGRIIWNGIKMNPYTFLENFRLYGGQVLFDKKDTPKRGYRFKNQITGNMEKEATDIHFDPLTQIELRRQGLRPPNETNGMPCYLCEETKELGYFGWFVDGDLRNFDRASIGYRVLRS